MMTFHSFRCQPQPFGHLLPGVISMEDRMEPTEKLLDTAIEQMKQLGVSRKDGKELTREDAAKLLGVMSAIFTDMGSVMQESFAQLQAIFGRFAARVDELNMTMDRPPEKMVQVG